jgi:TRAP-type C4-dicarboxylate transport system substrate-binding protein
MGRAMGTRKALLCLCMGALSATVFGAPVEAAEREWKLHGGWNEARPETPMLKMFAEMVNARAADKLKITVYPNAQLGIADADILRVLQRGAVVQAAGLWPGFMSRDEPQYANILPTGVVNDEEAFLSLFPTMQRIYEETYKKWGIRMLGMLTHAVKLTHVFCKTPVNDLATLRTKKVRVYDRALVKTFEKLAVSAQIIPQNDLYVALQTGVVDCALSAGAYGKALSLHEVAPYAAQLTTFFIQPVTLIVSEKAWAELTPELQKILEEAAAKVFQHSMAEAKSGEFERTAMADLANLGAKFIAPFSDTDKKTYTQAAWLAWAELSAEAGALTIKNQELIASRIAKP